MHERESSGFETFNAKKLGPRELASTFVVPAAFSLIAGADNTYIIGPRGSGKTTLLRMLQGESLMAWHGGQSERLREQINYASIFLPADELWASQVSSSDKITAFTAQLLYSLVETMLYRSSPKDSFGNPSHLYVDVSHDQEVSICRQCADTWGLQGAVPSFLGLLESLDKELMSLATASGREHRLGQGDGLNLVGFGVRAFNRAVGQPHQKWALLLDEMELAPPEIHKSVIRFVRGGSQELILKVSTSPFDRYMNAYGVGGGPIPGHDFQTVYLAGQDRAEIAQFTRGLWKESLRSRGHPNMPMGAVLGMSSIAQGGPVQTPARRSDQLIVLKRMRTKDDGFRAWLTQRKIDLDDFEQMSYEMRSSTIRKIYPLLIFRDAVLNFREGRPVRRSRKKHLEPFTGAQAVTTMLEGNPRWIKTAFAEMLNSYDASTRTVSRGFQYTALVNLASRFESLLRVLPRREAAPSAVSVTELVDNISQYMSRRNTEQFSSDPQNCFTVDTNTAPSITEALVLGLYAGAFVHVRDRASAAVLSDFSNQRFRLAYLLAIRDQKEFPLRLGRDARLGAILGDKAISAPSSNAAPQTTLDWTSLED